MRAHYRDDIAAVPLAGSFLAPVAGGAVHVYEEGTSVHIAETIYAGPTGAATLSNPLTSSANAEVEFWLNRAKRVDLVSSKGGFADRRIRVDVGKLSLDEFDVRDYGATGDGVTDDTVAINAAVTAMPDTGGTLRFGFGKYLVTSTIDLTAKGWVRIQGVGFTPGNTTATSGSVLSGNFSGVLLRYGPGAGTTLLISGMTLLNSHASGTAFHLEGVDTSTIENIQVYAAGIGIQARVSTFTVTFRGVVFRGIGGAGIGMSSGGHMLMEGCDFAGLSEGIRASGTTVDIIGCRFEVNITALRLGVAADGTTLGLSRSLISGNSFEANDTDIDIVSLQNSTVSGIGAGGSVNSPSGQSKSGLVVRSASDVQFVGLAWSGSYSDVTIRIDSNTGRQVWCGVSASNTHGTGKLWDVKADLTGISFQNCNYTLRPDDDASHSFLQRAGRFQALAGIDYLNASIEGKNLRHKALAVGGGATTLAVTFTAAGHAAGNAAISTATATAGVGLADGTYYYIATAVTARGESGGTSEKTVTCGGGNNQVTLVFFGMPADGFKRRIYRGTAPGIYDGYYETALNSNANFIDTGTALARRKSPSTQESTDMREPDTSYEVFVTPDWNTTWWITGKATTGYTINFGTAAPGGGGTVGAFYVR